MARQSSIEERVALARLILLQFDLPLSSGLSLSVVSPPADPSIADCSSGLGLGPRAGCRIGLRMDPDIVISKG